TFGKRLKPKRIEEAMPLLDDVFVLEQSGKEVTIKLKDQAEKRSDSPQSVSGNLLGTGCRIHVAPAPVAPVTGESGITLPSPSVHEIMNQQWGEMPTDERQSLPPVGYERL
ncbi:unnamed protein product, partial [Porites lobata]